MQEVGRAIPLRVFGELQGRGCRADRAGIIVFLGLPAEDTAGDGMGVE